MAETYFSVGFDFRNYKGGWKLFDICCYICINKFGLIDVNTTKIIIEKTSFIFHMIVNVVFLAWLIVRIDYEKVSE